MLISVQRTATDGYRFAKFKGIFKESPSDRQVADAQIQAGYHPAGYGGPYRIVRSPQPDGTVAACWESSGSCD